MKKLFYFIILYGFVIGLSNRAFSDSFVIPLCGKGGAISVKSDNLFIKSDAEKTPPRLIPLPFHAYGGAVDAAGKFFVVYGTPFKIDKDYPQASEYLVFEGIKNSRLIHKGQVGGGIYDAGFSKDGRYVVIDEKSGTLIFDLSSHTEELLGKFSEGPAVQACNPQ